MDDLTIEDYEKTFKDHQRLVHKIDVIINGDNAAQQASLCDLVGQIKQLVTDHRYKYASITYSLAPCRSCKSGRIILIDSGRTKHKVRCLGHPEDPLFSGKRIKCDIQTKTYPQWTDAVNEWNRKNR